MTCPAYSERQAMTLNTPIMSDIEYSSAGFLNPVYMKAPRAFNEFLDHYFAG